MDKIKYCAVVDCSNRARFHGIYIGKLVGKKKYYGKYCQFHHRSKTGKGLPVKKSIFSKDSIKKFKNSKCEKCGWDKSYCDRHRIKPELGYVVGNVVILCPNCHRLESLV